MFAKQSYWYKWRGLLFKLRRPRAFQLSRGLFTGCILIGWLQVTRWGRETETQVPAACQPQPRQPHIIKLISQLQKSTRRITDTWIIDTGKRETRYQLVKVHQTIRQLHKITQKFLQRDRRKVSIYMIFVKGEYMQSGTYFPRRFLPISWRFC